MYRTCNNKHFILCLGLWVFLSGSIVLGQGGMVGHWPLNETEGDLAEDLSGLGKDGIPVGAVEWQPADGYIDGALLYSSDDATCAVVIPTTGMNPNSGTVMVWAYLSDPQPSRTRYFMGHTTQPAWGNRLQLYMDGGNTMLDLGFGSSHRVQTDIITLDTLTWLHVALTWNNGAYVVYLNGASVASGSYTGFEDFYGTMDIGNDGQPTPNNTEAFGGMLDEAKIFNRALSPNEIQQAMRGGVELASKPYPGAGVDDIPLASELRWTPGRYAAFHDVYFGKNFQDVNEAIIGDTVYQGRQEKTSFKPISLERGETYFWRIDEVNSPPDNTVFTGDVWSFTVTPVAFAIPIGRVNATASSVAEFQDAMYTVDGSGLNDQDQHSNSLDTMWQSAVDDVNPWIQFEFSQLEKLHRVHVWNHNSEAEGFIGFGVKEAILDYSVDGVAWERFGTVEIAQADGLSSEKGNSIDLGGIVAQFIKISPVSNWSTIEGINQVGLSEVRFYAVPMRARTEEPTTGIENLDVPFELAWRSGRGAVEHEVMMGSDPDNLVRVATTTEPVYAPNVDLGKTVYWQINEVNSLAEPAVWEGPVWSFSTVPYVTIDDMEEYKAKDGHYIWETWTDGYEVPSNGSLLDNNSNDMERQVAYDGRQSMHYYYGEDGASTSEASLKLNSDWSKFGIASLSLMFHGTTTNTPGKMMMMVNGTMIATYPTASDLTLPQWQAWTIDLPDSVRGNVNSLSIRFEGGSGLVYFDAIRLYPQKSELVTPELPSDTALLAHYAFDGSFDDISGNGLHGSPVLNPAIVNDSERGQVVSLEGNGSCVDLGVDDVFNFTDSFTISAWVNISNLTETWGHAIISKRGENGVGWQLRRESNSSNLCFTLRGPEAPDQDPKGITDMTFFYRDWCHVVAVYDMESSQRTVYINGRIDASVPSIGLVNPTDHNVYIGGRATSGNTGQEGFFEGMLDDVRIYKRALSQAEALGLAQRQEPVYKKF